MRTRVSRLLPLLIAMVLLMFVGAACTPEAVETPTEPTQEETPIAGTTTYAIDLAPVAGVTSSATGKANFEVGADSITFTLDAANLSGITMAHLHIAETAGGNGPPGAWLYTTEKAPKLIPGPTNGQLSAGTIDASSLVGPLEGKTMADLVTAIEEGRAYVNIHTETNPDGEIAGFLK